MGNNPTLEDLQIFLNENFLDRYAGMQTEEHEHLSNDRQTNDEQP